MIFEVKRKIQIPNCILDIGTFIEYDGKSHYFNITLKDSHLQKLSVPYIFGISRSGYLEEVKQKDIPEARKRCKEFVNKLFSENEMV